MADVRNDLNRGRDILQWQTPNSQRLWGILGAIIPTGMIMFAMKDWPKFNAGLLWLGGLLLVIALLMATWTVKFKLDLSARTYESVRGFLPVLLGDRGDARSAFQCVAIRTDAMLDAKAHEDDPNAKSFEQFRIVLVWKEPGKDPVLLDLVPDSYAESLQDNDFHAEAIAVAGKVAERLGVDMIDQSPYARRKPKVSGQAVVAMVDDTPSIVS